MCRIAHKKHVGIAFSTVARRSHVVVAAQHGVDWNNTHHHVDESCLAFCTVSISLSIILIAPRAGLPNFPLLFLPPTDPNHSENSKNPHVEFWLKF